MGKDEPQELDQLAREKVEVFGSAVDELADSAKAGDADGFDAALNQMLQLAQNSGFDQEAFLNALHVPEDAGEYEEELRDMLGRIPNGWGRWISCSRGWYPLVTGVNRQLRELFPDYEIHQVKEKYGSLSYYWGGGMDLYEQSHPSPEYPGKESSETDKEAWGKAFEAWAEERDAWWETEEGQNIKKELQRRGKIASQIVSQAEQKSVTICELCGQDGHMTACGDWMQTLCISCAKGKKSDYSIEYLSITWAGKGLETEEDAQEMISEIEAADPDQQKQWLSVSLWEEDQEGRELGSVFLNTILDYVATRRCQLAEEWGADNKSLIEFGSITEQAQEALSDAISQRGLRDRHKEWLERQAASEEFRKRWAAKQAAAKEN